jgi:hypothetical protein
MKVHSVDLLVEDQGSASWIQSKEDGIVDLEQQKCSEAAKSAEPRLQPQAVSREAGHQGHNDSRYQADAIHKSAND